MRISDWSSDVCSSDLGLALPSDAAYGCGDVSRSGGGMSSINKKKGILTVNTHIRKRILALAIATLGTTPLFAYAQSHDVHSSHTSMPASSVPADAACLHGMDHTKMKTTGNEI